MSVQNRENSVALMETELARLIVEQKLATADEVEQCLTLMARRGVSEPQAVAQTFVDMGVATPGQIQRECVHGYQSAEALRQLANLKQGHRRSPCHANEAMPN